MASDEGNEGKNLALEMKKQKFEQDILKLIELNKEGSSIVYNNYAYNIIMNEEEESIELRLDKVPIASIKNGVFEYNIEALRALKNSISVKYEDLGLPDLEYLGYLEKENDERNRDGELDNPEERDGELDNPEKLDEEELDEESIVIDDDNESIDSENLTRKADWIKLDGTVEITRSETVMDLIPGANEYSGIYIAPSEDYHTYTFMGQMAGTNKYEKIDSLEITEGENPTQDIMSLDANQSIGETKTPSMMVKIRGREDEGFAIEPSTGHEGPEVKYWRKAFGDMYISTTIPREGRDGQYDDVSLETKYLMSRELTSDRELEEILEHSENMESISQRDLPEEIDPTADGIQIVELNIAEFKAIMQEKVEAFLREESNDHPDLIRIKAEKIVNAIVDEGMNYEQAKEAAERSGREDGGMIPADSILKKGE